MPRKTLKKRADGRYIAHVDVGQRPDGSRIRKTVYGSTQKEVLAKADEIRAQNKRGIDLDAQCGTFGEWCDKWLAEKACGAVQLRAYRSEINHFREELEHVELRRLRTSDFQKVINGLAKGEQVRSRATLNKIRMSARQVLQLAVDNRVIEYNCAAALKIPATAAPPTKREALTEEQVSWIRETESRAQLPALIMLYCGLRRGEIMALRVGDIDLVNNTLHVRRSVKIGATGTGKETAGAKTEAGVRDIPIPSILHQYLSALPDDPSALVSPGVGDRIHSERTWKTMWDRYMSDIADSLSAGEEMKPFGAHQLRHTYATMLFEAGVDVVAAKALLGHEDVTTTLGVYTHLRESHASLQAEKFENYLKKAEK